MISGFLPFPTAGDTFFFKGNSYWVLKSGRMDHDTVNSKSIATDWMFCPTPTPAVQSPFPPQCPKCPCDKNQASTFTGPSFLLIAILFHCVSVLI